MSTFFIVVALLTAALAIVAVLGALLVLGGVVAVQSGRRRTMSPPAPPPDPRSLAPTQALKRASRGRQAGTGPTPKRGPSEARRDDPTAAYPVGNRAVPAYSSGETPREGRATEMFGTNAGNFSELIDDDVERR